MNQLFVFSRMIKVERMSVLFIFIFIYVMDNNSECTTNSTQKYATVTYDLLTKLKDNPNYLLIDVREPSELDRDGFIPGSINIPLNDVEKVLTNSSPAEFKKIYGRTKPGKDFNIIFSCRSGRRSGIAQEKAISLGYKNVINYSGSWLDWEENTKGNTGQNS